MTKPVTLTEKQISALLTGTIHDAFAEAIAIANKAQEKGVTVALVITHKQIGNVPHKTLMSRFDVMQ